MMNCVLKLITKCVLFKSIEIAKKLENGLKLKWKYCFVSVKVSG